MHMRLLLRIEYWILNWNSVPKVKKQEHKPIVLLQKLPEPNVHKWTALFPSVEMWYFLCCSLNWSINIAGPQSLQFTLAQYKCYLTLFVSFCSLSWKMANRPWCCSLCRWREWTRGWWSPTGQDEPSAPAAWSQERGPPRRPRQGGDAPDSRRRTAWRTRSAAPNAPANQLTPTRSTSTPGPSSLLPLPWSTSSTGWPIPCEAASSRGTIGMCRQRSCTRACEV